MTEFFLTAAADLAVAGLIILQLKLLKKYYPNAELFIGLFQRLNMNKKTPENK
jgi:hypothetical protein